ncbi:MAG: tRNA lysidine(34) synthetase TilS [Methylomicrobium sp.]
MQISSNAPFQYGDVSSADCVVNRSLIESILAKAGPVVRLFVAYSGGVDSHVLLHLCASLPELKKKVTAVHIHHGLQVEADHWVNHCRSISDQLGVAFLDLYVDARHSGRRSPEEAARNARYAALKSLLSEGDGLLVAQHREDQLETVLLQLFRGAGLSGLAGMPEATPFGAGMLLRPFLHVAKRDIDRYARQHGLDWVEDPSNRISDYDRNFLRNEIIPLLKQRWPAIDKTVTRSAGHCAEADSLIFGIAEQLFEQVFDAEQKALSVAALSLLAKAEQTLVVRRWFKVLDLQMPSQAFVRRLLMLLDSRSSEAKLFGQGRVFCRFRNKLYCIEPAGDELPEILPWLDPTIPLELPGGRRFVVEVGEKGIDPDMWYRAKIEIKFRSGGEKIALPKRAGRHSLKKLYQEADIPPWQRSSIPLVYIDGRLAAVGEDWIDAAFYREDKSGCIRFAWVGENKTGKVMTNIR